jgi:hypothetical protein
VSPNRYRCPVVNLTGQRFQRLTVLKEAGRDNQGRALWLCRCACGVVKTIPSRHLRNGVIRSCGCLKRELSANNGLRGASKLRGAQSHLYKPSLTEADRLNGRNLIALREWRKRVFLRDDYTCAVCKKRGLSLQAHHLHDWASKRGLRFVLSNGVTLCRTHHLAFHRFMGGPRVQCTPNDFNRYVREEIEFLKKQS